MKRRCIAAGEGGGELSRPITSQLILRIHPLPSVMAIGQFITHTRTKWRHQEVSSVWAVDTESETKPGYTKKELCCLSIKNELFKHKDNDNK